MRTCGFLLVIILLFLLLLKPIYMLGQGKVANCEITVEVEKKDCTSGQADGEITVKPQSGTAPFKYIFYEVKTGRLLEKDFTKQRIQKLKKGTYQCRVIDNSGCNKQVEFTIQ